MLNLRVSSKKQAKIKLAYKAVQVQVRPILHYF